MTFYVYGLCEHGSDEIRYVGMTPRLKKRFQEHCRQFRGTVKDSWLRDLLASGGFPEMVILARSETRDFALETEWISMLRAEGHRLTNMEDVIRENLLVAARKSKSAIHRARISAAQKGIPRGYAKASLRIVPRRVRQCRTSF